MTPPLGYQPEMILSALGVFSVVGGSIIFSVEAFLTFCSVLLLCLRCVALHSEWPISYPSRINSTLLMNICELMSLLKPPTVPWRPNAGWLSILCGNRLLLPLWTHACAQQEILDNSFCSQGPTNTACLEDLAHMTTQRARSIWEKSTNRSFACKEKPVIYFQFHKISSQPYASPNLHLKVPLYPVVLLFM